MKVIKYTIYQNGAEECFFWTPLSQVNRLNLILARLIRFSVKFIPILNYQFDYKETEIE